MRLPRRAPRRIAIPAAPFANLALLLVMVVAVAAMYSVAGGVWLRFAPVPASLAGEAGPAAALIVAVGVDGEVRFEGIPVSPDGLAAAVRSGLERDPRAGVVLVVAPSAPYQAAIDAVAPLLRGDGLGGRVLSIPNRRQIAALRADPTAAGRLP